MTSKEERDRHIFCFLILLSSATLLYMSRDLAAQGAAIEHEKGKGSTGKTLFTAFPRTKLVRSPDGNSRICYARVVDKAESVEKVTSNRNSVQYSR